MLGIGGGLVPATSSHSSSSVSVNDHDDAQHLVCVRCKYCATVLAVNVPHKNMMEIVSVTCGHCTSLLSVDLTGLFHCFTPCNSHQSKASSSTPRNASHFPIAAAADAAKNSAAKDCTEKRQRVPSAYNQFIREEIQRIKATNPGISHKEAFSAAAKNWAHLGLIVGDKKKTEK